jgi:hypothetical protein
MTLGGISMKIIVAGAACALLCGCTLGNFTSIHRSVDMTGGQTQIVDAKQRLVVSYPREIVYGVTGPDGKTYKKKRQKRALCAEPSPDAFSVFAASGEFGFETPKVEGSGSAALSETGASLLERTTALQALRDAYFRLCEAHANGSIDDIDLMIGQRHNQTALVGLIAIEQITNSAKRAPIIIGGEAEASSASALILLDANLEKVSHRRSELETQNNQDDRAAKKLDEDAAELRKQAGANPAPPNKAALEELASNKENESKSLKERIKERQKEIDRLQQRIARLEDAIENYGPTGSRAGSNSPLLLEGDWSVQANSEIAQRAKEIVEIVGQIDFGPTTCLAVLRRDGGGGPAVEKCKLVLDSYIANMKTGAILKAAFADRLPRLTNDQAMKVLDALAADNSIVVAPP